MSTSSDSQVADPSFQSAVSTKPEAADQSLTLLVYAPREVDPRTFTWPKTLKVAEAARLAAAAFGYSGESTPKLQRDDESGEVLDPQKPLVAERLKDGDALTLIADGGGV